MAREDSRPATLPDVVVAPASPAPACVTVSPRWSLFRALRRCWMLGLLLGLPAGGLVGTLLWFAVPQQYSAETRIRVLASGIESSAGHADAEETAGFVRTQATLIRSTAVLETVLHRPEVECLAVIRDESDPLAWLSNHLTVAVSTIPDLLFVRVNAPRADDAVVLVRAVGAVYRAVVVSRQETRLRQLKDVRRRTEVTLHQKRQRLAELDNPRLRTAEKECRQARFDLRIARAELADREQRRVADERVNVSEQAILAYLKEDAIGRERLREVEALEENIQKTLRVSAAKERDPQLPEFYRARESAYTRLKAREEEVRQLIEQRERRRIGEQMQTQRNRCREQVVFYEGLVKALEEEARNLGGGTDVAQELKTLREETVVAGETLRKLASEEERLHNAAEVVSIVQTDEPVALQRTNGKERIRPAIVGGVSCCALLVLAVSWHEVGRGRIGSHGDIVGGLGLTVVGNIPGKRMDAARARRQFDGGGRVGEAVDALRTVLLQNGVKGPRLLLVTSAVGGEGKTSLAVLLAASLARAWRKTLLLDADLRKPQIHELFAMPLEPGLSEVLRGEAEIADVVQPTELSRLWMIPAGHGDAHAIQALAQDGAGRLFDPLKEQFDFIVIDACPVLPVADALLLCSHVDCVLLAVRSRLSRLSVVRAAKQRLATLDAPLRGAVLIGPDDDLDGKAFIYPPK